MIIKYYTVVCAVCKVTFYAIIVNTCNVPYTIIIQFCTVLCALSKSCYKYQRDWFVTEHLHCINAPVFSHRSLVSTCLCISLAYHKHSSVGRFFIQPIWPATFDFQLQEFCSVPYVCKFQLVFFTFIREDYISVTQLGSRGFYHPGVCDFVKIHTCNSYLVLLSLEQATSKQFHLLAFSGNMVAGIQC